MGLVAVRSILCTSAAALLLIAAPAHAADPVGQLDALSQATDKDASGLALAREQLGAGQLLDAMSTLERLILNNPDNDEARLLHASALCRIDDLPGSMVEFDDLRGHDLSQDQWSDAVRPCNAMRATPAPENKP
jgi:hypothetical protein